MNIFSIFYLSKLASVNMVHNKYTVAYMRHSGSDAVHKRQHTGGTNALAELAEKFCFDVF